MISQDLYLLGGIVAAIVVAWLAYRFRALTASGAVAAAIVGSIVFGMGGYVGAIALIYFFLSGSFLSRLRRAGGVPLDKTARDWKQVVCNGIPAALAVMLLYFVPSYRESATLFFLGALATATADTWATELGIRFSKTTFHILTFRPVERGISGGVSVAGILASFGGAVTFALIPFLLLPGDDFLCGLVFVATLPIVAAAGVVGSVLDSVIGATLQAKYRTQDGTIIEKREPDSRLVSGIPIVTNDVTNFLATTWGGLIAVGLTTLY